MSDQWGTREQPSEPEPHELGSEHALLAVGLISITVAIVLAILDRFAHADNVRGLYSILTGLFVVGMAGWLVRSGQSRVRRQVECHARVINEQLAELTSAVEKLRGEAGQAHVTYLPAPPCRPQGHMYVSQSAGGDGDTVPLMPKVDRPAVDEDALREQVEQVVAEELGTREAVRSQGYAEGYVDGVARRKDDDPPN